MKEVISMEMYSEMFYKKQEEITQGCIIPIIEGFGLKEKDEEGKKRRGLFIIENGCNLVEEVDRPPKVDMVEYILLYDIRDLHGEDQRIIVNRFKSIIQNRKFETEIVYLPPHDLLKKCQNCDLMITNENETCPYCNNTLEKIPYGLFGICDESNFIPLALLKKYKLEKYLYVKTPYRDYIKNKYAQFKLHIPIHTVTDNESILWIICKILENEGEKTIEQLNKRLKLNNIESIVKDFTDKGILIYDETTKVYSNNNP